MFGHTARMGTDVAWPPQERALRHVAALSSGGPLNRGLRLTMNFHPDRMGGDRPILLKMTEDGIYRSQFVTGTSNGDLTAHPGGDRWRWESRIFGGAYDHAAAGERPVYGPLNYRRDAVGGAPRFGSSHFRLTIKTLARATFCGQEYVDLGVEIAVDGWLDPQIIGDAAYTGRYDPQALKKVWHCLARFGSLLRANAEAHDSVPACCPREPASR